MDVPLVWLVGGGMSVRMVLMVLVKGYLTLEFSVDDILHLLLLKH